MASIVAVGVPNPAAAPVSPFRLAEVVPLAEVMLSVVPFQECVQETPFEPVAPVDPLEPFLTTNVEVVPPFVVNVYTLLPPSAVDVEVWEPDTM